MDNTEITHSNLFQRGRWSVQIRLVYILRMASCQDTWECHGFTVQTLVTSVQLVVKYRTSRKFRVGGIK